MSYRNLMSLKTSHCVGSKLFKVFLLSFKGNTGIAMCALTQMLATQPLTTIPKIALDPKFLRCFWKDVQAHPTAVSPSTLQIVSGKNSVVLLWTTFSKYSWAQLFVVRFVEAQVFQKVFNKTLLHRNHAATRYRVSFSWCSVHCAKLW